MFTRLHNLSAFLLLSEQKLVLDDIFVVGNFSLWDDII